MLQYGKDITVRGDQLHNVSVEDFAARIQAPKEATRNKIDQLRALKELDASAYSAQKKRLPYIVCGIFEPPIRRRENLKSIEYFILDLDHVTIKFEMASLKSMLSEDERVVLIFQSPGGDGMKIMFRLAAPCVDSGLYAAFYKKFIAEFCSEYGLDSVLDSSTSDTTRACFISYDEDMYYNPDAVAISINTYFENLSPDEIIFGSESAEAKKVAAGANTKGTVQDSTRATEKKDPSEDVLFAIRQRLNPSARPAPNKKQYILAPEVEEISGELQEYISGLGMMILESNPINYGRKIKVGAERLWAEVNIFYGKKGFTVVTTPKSGSHSDLAGLAAEAIRTFLYAKEELKPFPLH